jgi:hypothetical protein
VPFRDLFDLLILVKSEDKSFLMAELVESGLTHSLSLFFGVYVDLKGLFLGELENLKGLGDSEAGDGSNMPIATVPPLSLGGDLSQGVGREDTHGSTVTATIVDRVEGLKGFKDGVRGPVLLRHPSHYTVGYRSRFETGSSMT